mmetsp:Transcript_10738/g.20685  ORF Transcript_10738/g.20685 Transcript_10738/m.20685 type:complete len:398 (+) Transcript_10738:304-1497(+)
MLDRRLYLPTLMSQEDLSTLERLVKDAMLLLDQNLTHAYYRALEIIPDIVQQETKIRDFLYVENNDPQKAATRLARYWQTRKDLFVERWQLPMTQTGTGCLSDFDIGILRSGYMKLAHSATHGAVLIIDFAFLPPGVVRTQTRIPFYLLSICPCELTSLHVIRGEKMPAIELSSRAKDILFGNTATRLKNLYLAHAYEPGKERLIEFLGYQQTRVVEHNFQVSIPSQHRIMGKSVSSTLKLLAEAGFECACLPVELGGNIDKAAFQDWIRMRLTIEGAAGALLTTNLAKVPNQKRQRESFTIEKRPEETQEDFAKRKNAAYVRRNYHRQKNEIMIAEGEADGLRQRNDLLRADNERLQRLLAQANDIIVQILDPKMSAHVIERSTTKSSSCDPSSEG